MRAIPSEPRREDILFAFQEAAPRPTIDDIASWITRYPDLADDIREYAEIMLEIAQTEDPSAEPSQEILDRTRASTRAILEAARTRNDESKPVTTFADLLSAACTTVPDLARSLGIGRAVLTDLVQGRMQRPIPDRFAHLLAAALKTSADAIKSALVLAVASPQTGHAKARGISMAAPRTFQDIVRDDPTMTQERKAFWLDREE